VFRFSCRGNLFPGHLIDVEVLPTN
jgi:hypothetical protein